MRAPAAADGAGVASAGPRGRHLGPISLRPADLAVAAIACILDVVLLSNLVPDLANKRPAHVAVTLGYVVVAFVLLTCRKARPLPVLCAITVASAACSQVVNYRSVLPVAVAVATAVGTEGSLQAVVGLVVATGAIPAWVRSESAAGHTSSLGAVSVGVGYCVILLVAAGVGLAQRLNRQRVMESERRREVEAAEAVLAERLRVARELHDIVASAVTIMVIQSAGARRIMPTDPARAEEALGAVEAAGTRAMAELRRLLGALRGVKSGPEQAEDSMPTVSDIPALAESALRSGIGVELRVEGDSAGVDTSVSLAAFRVVQEALTNVTRHAGTGTAAEVVLRWMPDCLEVSVIDDGSGKLSTAPRLQSGGHGLLGLSERVVMVGGELVWGRRPEGGFSVRARLPLADVPVILDAPQPSSVGPGARQP